MGRSCRGRLREIACDESRSVADRRSVIQALRAELDVATPEGRAQAERIRLFLEAWDRADGGPLHALAPRSD